MIKLLNQAKAWLTCYAKNLLHHVPTGLDGVARVGARQIYILPTRTGLMFGSVLLLMLLGSLNYQNNLGLLFTFFLASVGLVAMHHAWFNLLGIAVQARGGPPVFSGETAMIDVSLLAEGRRARHDIQARKGHDTALPVHVPGGNQRRVSLGLPTTRRGLLTIETMTIETQHPMRLFRAWCYIATDASTLIYPAPARHAPDPGYAAGDARLPDRTGGEGADDYLGSRNYRHGDSPRQIDWKAFARERGLVVKQFGGDQGQEVWIDWSRLAAPDPEVRLGLLTRQILDVSESGVRFGLRLPGAVEGLAQGAAHVQRCLTRLALFDHAHATDPVR
ncbi:DUF58 domain-containing protein [Thiocystis minor]|uniref:DUF58 domain-containing protein n=1 Tax=Thiocystis minor TaxID=61597 RepID=UPI0019130592|nr:DUF58 domain-containing protein [Thiocystis minor]MBK5966923.1 DUF58 domain-containing protein [Thiocystis minor]